jgi:hypothetical protein
MDDQGTQDFDQSLDHGPAGAWLPLAAAAVELGVSAKTVRRRLKSGDVLSRQVTTQHGQAYEVWVPVDKAVDNHVSTVNGQGTHRVDDVTTVELVRLVDRLQRENRDLAGLVGALQERVGTLQAALEAPRPDPAQMATGRDSEHAASTSTQTPADPPQATPRARARWWQWWARPRPT